LVAARACLSIPLVAIGGIAPENGRRLIEAGADLLAAVAGVFAAADIAAAARAYSQLFPPLTRPTEDRDEPLP
jgi:thiamine-phosphate pyrophosphorylase